MNEQDLYDGITHVKGRYIEEAASTPLKRRSKVPFGAVAVAACLCLVVAGGKLIFPDMMKSTSEATTSPPTEEATTEESVEESIKDTATGSTAVNLLADLTPNGAEPLPPSNESLLGTTRQVANLAMQVFGQVYDGENLVISPLSIGTALTMAANGAQGETLAQMEAALGRDVGTLNQYLYGYQNWLPSTELCQVTMANSIWYRDANHLNMNQDFLQTNVDFHLGDLYKAPFDDQTVVDINQWVEQETGGEIQEFLKEPISEEVMIYLINALSFDGKWQRMYEDYQVRDGIFTTGDGTEQEVEMMHSEETSYLEMDGGIGFVKDYDGGQYSFVGILPDGDLDGFLDGLTGDALLDAVQSASHETVQVVMPKFSAESDMELSQVLKDLGMADAFSYADADFSAMATSEEGNLFLGDVLHQTTITVDQQGTKAGAVTGIGAELEAAEPEEPKTVALDRPFFFMIVDNTVSMPIFLGTIGHIE